MTETNRIEFKRELTRELDIEKEVVAFLNYREGGTIYVGIADDGTPVGVKDINADMLKIKDRIRNGISPSPMGLFDVTMERIDGIPVIRVFVASGSEKPYYKTPLGMSPKGCYIRVGTAAEPMTQMMIDDLYARRARISLRNIPAPRQDLTFQQLQIYYQNRYHALGENFAKTLLFYTDEGKYNYVAYLFADENDISIKFAKYAGNDRDHLIENNEYGYCSLLKAADAVLERFKIENIVSTKKTYPYRQDRPLWDNDSIRELVFNAFIHNDYLREVPPKFELFSDHLEITSTGGLPNDLTEDEFFRGVSVPRNKEVMRIFRDVQMGESLGSGMLLVGKHYPVNIFSFMPHFLRISIGYCEQYEDSTTQKTTQKTGKKTTQKTDKKTTKETNFVIHDIAKRKAKVVDENSTSYKILTILEKHPEMSRKEVAEQLGCSEDNIRYHIKKLRAKGQIIHKGPDKGGYWLVLSK